MSKKVAVTARVYKHASNAASALITLADRIQHAAHAKHRKALYGQFNKVSNTAASLRRELSELSANTRDATLQAKVDYQRALKAAEVAFNDTLASVQANHEKQRDVIVPKLSKTNEQAALVQIAIEHHDGQV